jgi:hypothetical protein
MISFVKRQTILLVRERALPLNGIIGFWEGMEGIHRFLGGYGNMYLKFYLSSTPL